MKIGLVLDDTLDSSDGVQQYVRCLGEWLRTRGHEVHYLVGETRQKDLKNIHSLSKNLTVSFNGNTLSTPKPVDYRTLKKLVNDLRLDVLHVQVPYSPLMAGRLVRSVAPDVAIVGTFHILPYAKLARLGSAILGKVNTPTAKCFDVMMAVSMPAREFAGRYFGFRSVIVANPFHHDQFSVARRGKPVKQTTKRIVYLGRLVARKGPVELLDAIALLEQRKLTKVPYEVIVAGKGSLLPKLEHMARNTGIENNVSFPGFVAESDKARLLASGDIVVFPSVSGESFGISLLEGMAASRGVVLAGDNPGYASVVASKKQLFNPRDTAAFARLLARWLDNDGERETMAKRQQTHVKQFDIDVIGPKIEELYAHALQKRRQS